MWWLLAHLALAQDLDELPALNAQLWRPSIDARQTLWADDARVHRSLTPIARVYAGYVNEPLTFVPLDIRHDTPPPAPALELVLGDGRLLRIPQGFDPAVLRPLLTALEDPSC